MATQHLALPHTHLSNRAKVRSTLGRKPVFRSVLDNPFQIRWPPVPVNVQNTFLARLVAALENIPLRASPSRRFPHKPGRCGHQGNVDITEELEHANIHTNPSQTLERACTEGFSSAPPHLIVGINEVTRALESQLCLARKHAVVDNLTSDSDQLPPRPTPFPIIVVFVCCADIDPTALIDHIPYLVAGCNSPRNVTQPIKLVPLPKGSESVISQIFRVRRAAAVAFRRGSPLFETVQDILDSVPIVSAPWLCPSDTQDTSQLVPTHIKQLHTIAPKDMRAAREQRAKARAAAKKTMSSSSRSIRRKPRLTLTTESERAD